MNEPNQSLDDKTVEDLRCKSWNCIIYTGGLLITCKVRQGPVHVMNIPAKEILAVQKESHNTAHVWWRGDISIVLYLADKAI